MSNYIEEHFNAGNPPLSMSDYPGSEFPSQCGGGYGYGGSGDYAMYGSGCGAKAQCGGGAHQPGCMCPTCQAPYSMPYKAGPAACGNANCQCANCNGNCKCGAKAAMMPTLPQFGLGFELTDLVRYVIMAVIAYYVIMYAMKLLRRRR